MTHPHGMKISTISAPLAAPDHANCARADQEGASTPGAITGKATKLAALRRHPFILRRLTWPRADLVSTATPFLSPSRTLRA